MLVLKRLTFAVRQVNTELHASIETRPIWNIDIVALRRSPQREHVLDGLGFVAKYMVSHLPTRLGRRETSEGLTWNRLTYPVLDFFVDYCRVALFHENNITGSICHWVSQQTHTICAYLES